MKIIRTVHQGNQQHPLQEAMRFVLINCLDFVNVDRYPEYTIIGNGSITNTEYQVDISVDEIEIHAYFRRPSAPRWPVLEIIFFRETAPVQ